MEGKRNPAGMEYVSSNSIRHPPAAAAQMVLVVDMLDTGRVCAAYTIGRRTVAARGSTADTGMHGTPPPTVTCMGTDQPEHIRNQQPDKAVRIISLRHHPNRML